MKLILIALGFATMAMAGPCTLQPIQAYLSMGSGGCSIGTYTYSGFSYAPVGTVSAPDLSNIFINPMANGNFTQQGFFIESPSLWSIGSGQTGGLTFGAHIVPNVLVFSTLILGATFPEFPLSEKGPAAMTITGLVSDQTGIIYSDSLVYDFGNSSNSNYSCCGAFVKIPPSTLFLDASVTQVFETGAGGSADISGTWLGFQSAPLPEPSAWLLTMTGLAGVIRLRRVKR